MKDPYEILGVSPQDDEAVIKAAYRRLCAQYYNLNDRVSKQRAEELNNAYDAVVRAKRAVSDRFGQNPISEFSDVRRMISDRRLSDAEEILDSVRSMARNGEWNYLKALILSKKGFMNEACFYAERALENDKFSEEFNDLYKRLSDSEDCGSALKRFSLLLHKLLRR